MNPQQSIWVDSKKDFPEDRVSYAVLKELAISPGAAIYKKRTPVVPTPAMKFGKAVDALMIGGREPDPVMSHPTSASTRTKEFAAAQEAFLQKDPKGVYLDSATYDQVIDCIKAIQGTEDYASYLAGLTWTPEYGKAGVMVEPMADGGVQCVANVLDVLACDPNNGEPFFITDLKCVNDPTAHAFRNQVDRMRWDVQAASYVRMVEQITGYRVPFYWFCVQNQKPWNVAVWECDGDWLHNAEQQLIRWVADWYSWKGFEPEGRAISLTPDGAGMLFEPPWRK